ncbi:unnamed protein product [Arabis nemorensis]|uniref:CASP-like protein n=1 Tax=Arabis nemorensis TaxID=586526 RepID=A0A565CMQ9_9BRAS|nr:unnamed protein product [Arabis nemorensis]
MERRKVVMCCVLSVLGLLSAATAFAAEATKVKRSQVKFTTSDSLKQCSYSRSPAFDLGFTSALFLMMAQIIVSVASGCLCCRKGPPPSRSNWIIAVICFVVSWFTFVIAFLVLLTGAALNDEHSEQTMYAGNYFCYVVKPGVFSIGSVLSLVTIALGIVYYLCLTSSKHNVAATTTTAANQGGIAMGQPQIPERVEDPVFVHEDTYMRRQFT